MRCLGLRGFGGIAAVLVVAGLGACSGSTNDAERDATTTSTTAADLAGVQLCSPEYGHLLVSIGAGDSLQHTAHRVLSFVNLTDERCGLDGSPEIDFTLEGGQVVHGVPATALGTPVVVPPQGAAYLSLRISTACNVMDPDDAVRTRADYLRVHLGGEVVAEFPGEPWILCNVDRPNFASVSIGSFSLNPRV